MISFYTSTAILHIMTWMLQQQSGMQSTCCHVNVPVRRCDSRTTSCKHTERFVCFEVQLDSTSFPTALGLCCCRERIGRGERHRERDGERGRQRKKEFPLTCSSKDFSFSLSLYFYLVSALHSESRMEMCLAAWKAVRKHTQLSCTEVI